MEEMRNEAIFEKIVATTKKMMVDGLSLKKFLNMLDSLIEEFKKMTEKSRCKRQQILCQLLEIFETVRYTKTGDQRIRRFDLRFQIFHHCGTFAERFDCTIPVWKNRTTQHIAVYTVFMES